MDDAGLQDCADVNSRAYGFSLEAGRAGIVGSKLWKEDAFTFVGYESGRPVSAASVIVNDGQLDLALIAAISKAQRKGHGEATVRHVLQQAHLATGLKRTNLHATDAGAPVYSRIGYDGTTRFLGYSLASHA
jgi:GNAT superfamily N-acetyltransferase